MPSSRRGGVCPGAHFGCTFTTCRLIVRAFPGAPVQVNRADRHACVVDGADHFHVHIVHAAQDGMMGMAVGQAHLLEDVISMVCWFLEDVGLF